MSLRRKSLTVAAAPLLAILLSTAGLVGCAPSISEGEFDADDPAAVLYAIHEAGERRDESKIPQLIEHLDADDPAVRMFAIVALEKITGTRHGYNPYDPRPQRQPAINKWVALYPGKAPSGGGGG